MTSKTLDYGLLVIRVVLGIVMVAHGSQKVFTFGHAGVTGAMGQMGLPMPAVSAALIMAAEFGGGLLLIAGLFTRFAAAAIAIGMAVASIQVHLPNGFFAPNGYEFTLMLAAAGLGTALTGPGRFSIDALIASRRRTPAADAYEEHATEAPRRVA